VLPPACSPSIFGVAKYYPPPGFSTEAVHNPPRVNVTCVTPLGEEVASTW
jgi:hypothetical protein